MNQSNDQMLCVAVIGAGGYVGGELLKLLANHPNVATMYAVSPSRKGEKVRATHQRLISAGDLLFVDSIPNDQKVDAVFFATPSGVAMQQAPSFLDQGATVIDCSPDFRLQDISVWEKWYGEKHACPELVKDAVYGLVELNKEALVNAKLIASPGCYATAVQLATVPIVEALAKQGCTQLGIFASCVSGTSGAGRRSDRNELLLAEADGNFQAYALSGHRHEPEILQGIKAGAGFTPSLRFVPHLLPIARGMFATVNFIGAEKYDLDFAKTIAAKYANDPLIDVLEKNVSPQVASVAQSSHAQISTAEGNVVLCAIDNLGKGAAGQAVQAFNVSNGFDENIKLST